MEIFDITSAVDTFFGALLPGIVEMIVIGVLLAWWIGFGRARAAGNYLLLRLQPLEKLLENKTIIALGIPKTVPLITIFMLVFSIILFHRGVQYIGNQLPGSISWTQPDLMVAVSSENIEEIWKYYPEIPNLHALFLVVEDHVHKGLAEKHSVLASGLQKHEERFGRFQQRVAAAKTILVLFVITLIAAKRWNKKIERLGRKITLTVICALVFMIISGFDAMESQKQVQWSKNLFTLTDLRTQRGRPQISNSERNQLIKKEIEDFLSRFENRKLNPIWPFHISLG